MEQPYSIIVSTCERKSLTGLTLDSIMACKARHVAIHIIDDASEEYDQVWLSAFGSDSVLRLNDRIGVGAMAKKRIEYALQVCDGDYFIFLDNDILASPGFDSMSVSLLKVLEARLKISEADSIEHSIVSPYRSALHEAQSILLLDQNNPASAVMKMKDIGGISMAMSRSTAKYLLQQMPQWDERWDYEVCKRIHHLYVPMQSLIEHTGRYGDGVNGESADRAFHFIGYTFSCQNSTLAAATV